MGKQNQKHTFDFTGILNAEINQQDWKAKKKLLEEQFGKFKIALETDLAEAEAQKILDMFNEKLNIQLNVEQVKKDAEAVKKIIETALASINNINTSALKGIEDTLEGIATTTEKIFNKIGTNAQNAFDNIDKGAKKASKSAIKSVGQVEAALKRVGKGTNAFKDIQNTVKGKFEIKNKGYTQQEAKQIVNDIAQQRQIVRENPNATWEQKYAADIKFVDAYKGYRVKFGQLSNETEGLYKSLLETYYDQKNMLQNIVNMGKSTKKNPKPLIGYDGGEPWARESTLQEVKNILQGGIKVSDDGGNKLSNHNQPIMRQDTIDVEKELQGIVSQFTNEYNKLLGAWGDATLNDDEFDAQQKELIAQTASKLKVNTDFNIQKAITDAMANGDSASELLKMLKHNGVGVIPGKSTTLNQQSIINDGAPVVIDEAALGNAIANALKGVQLNTNTQGEVKAFIDAAELKGVLHDGTAYDVKVIQDGGSNEAIDSATQDRISEELKQVERVIRNCKDWIQYLDVVLDDSNFTASGKGDAANKLRNRTNSLIDVRQHPEKYKAFEYSAEKAEIAWMKAYKEAERWGVAQSTLVKNRTDADSSYNSNVEKLSKEKMYWEDTLIKKESELQLLKQQLQNANGVKTTPGSSDANVSKVAIDETALESVLNRIFPKSDGNEPWAKDTTLGEVKSVLESIKANTDKFVTDNTDPRTKTLKKEIGMLKTKHPNDLFEYEANQKLITEKENELNNLGGKSANYTQLTTATENLQGVLGGITEALKQSNISETIILIGKTLEFLNNTLRGISSLVVVPTGSDITPQQIGVNSVSSTEEAGGLSKRKILTDADGNHIKRADTTVEKTRNAVKTTTQLFKYDESGNSIPDDILTVEDFERFAKEQKTESQKIEVAQAKLKEFLSQFNNKTLGKAEQISGYNELGELLKSPDTWDLDTIEKAKQGMLSLNAEFNKLSQNFRKGSSSLNPFVNAINNSDKLRSQIHNIQLDFISLKDTEETSKLSPVVAGLEQEFNTAQQLLNGGDIEGYSVAYGNLREKIVKVVNEIRTLRKEQGITQKSALFDENKELIGVRSGTQMQEWERMSYVPDELRDKFKLLHSELNNVVDQDELNIWKKQWEQIRIQITALRREHQGMEADLKEVLTIYEEIGRNEAKIEGLQSEGEKDVYRKRNIELEKEAQELAKIYGLNVDLVAIEKARTDAKNASMVRVDAAQERKSLQERIKTERKTARINASNTKWNAGQNALLDLWKIDNPDIDVDKIGSVKELSKALNDLSQAQKRADDAIRNNTQDTPDAIKGLKIHSQAVAGLTADVKELISNYERFSGPNATQLGGFTSGDWEQQITTAIQTQYPGAKIKSINHDLQEVTYELKTGARAFTEYTAGVRQADNKIVALKGTTRKLPTFLEGVKRKLGEISQYFSAMSLINRAMQELRKGVQYVREIDSALTELKKVTDETEATYDKFLDTASKTASKVGSTIKDVISSTADWARLGYSMKEAAQFAETTQILMNVSEFTDVSQATDTLISAVQAFGYTAETSMEVVDMLNTIGNNYAISTADLAQSLTKSSASLVAAGGNLAEAAALTATANAIVQDADSVGTALKTTSLRLRGTSVEILEEEGVDSDGAVTSKSKLQSKVKALSGVDILTATGEYKSTYEILSQIADVWGTINDMDQAALLELLAGKRNASVLAAILQSPKELKAAFEDANNAQGSALKENEKYMDSIQGKIDQFNNAIQTLWKNVLDDDVVKFFVELATSLVKILDKLGPIKVLIAGIMTYITKKNGIDIFNLIPMNAERAKKKIAELKAEIAKLEGSESQKNLQKKDALTQQLRTLEAQVAPSQELVAAQDKLTKAQNRLANAKQKAGTAKEVKPETIKRYEREVNKAKTEVDNLTKTQKTAGKTGGSAFKALGKSVKNLAVSISKALIQMAAMMAIMQLVQVITEAIDNAYTTAEEAAEAFEELTNELKNTKSELEGINDELKTLDDKIAELTAKDKLSFIQQDELDRLKEERAELERELELQKALAQQKQEQVNSQTSGQVQYYKDKGVKSGKTVNENVHEAGSTAAKAGGIATAAAGLAAFGGSMSWNVVGWIALAAAAVTGIVAGVAYAIADGEEKIGDAIDNMEANLDKKEKEVEKARDAYQKSGSDEDKEKYEKAQQALSDYRGEMSKYFTELGEYYDNVDLSEEEDPDRYKALKKEMNDFYNERDKWLITSGSEGATSNAIERVFDKKENKKAKEDIEALMEQLKEDPGNTAIEQKIKNIINGSESLKEDFEAIGIELNDVAHSFTQMAEEQLFGTLDGKIEELERATTVFKNLLNGSRFNFEGKNIGLADLFTDEGEVVQTKLSEIFKGTSAETREAITGLLERSYDDIQNGTVNIETLLGEFASRSSEAILGILKETSSAFEEISENIDKIQDSYSTLSNAVEQYNSAGFLTLDNLQSLLSLEPEYLALLQMENGQLTINQAGYEALIQTKLAEAKASIIQSGMTELNALAARKEEDAINDASTATANSISNLGTYANTLSDVTKNAIGAAGAVYAFNNAVAGAQANELVSQEEIDAVVNRVNTGIELVSSLGSNLSTNFGSIMTGGEGGDPKEGGEDSEAWDNFLKKHQAELDAIAHEKDLIQAEIDEAEAKGFIASEQYYNQLIALEQKEKNALIAKKQAMLDFYNAYSASMSTDEIEEWNAEMRETVLGIAEADKNMIEFGNTIREIGEEYFDKISEDIDAINEEIEFMHGLLEDEPVADENGNWSNEALTRLGLYTQQMEKAAFETQRAKDELAELRASTSEEDKNSDWYREKEEELTQAIYDSTNAYNDYKDGIVELNEARIEAIKEGIDKEIEAYQELIDNKKEALDAERDLYDFKKSVTEQNKSIADTERKLAALSGSTAAEDIAERKRLEAELRKQKGDLDDTYYDHSIESQQNALDEESRYFEEAQQRRIESLEAMLENTEELIVNSMMDVMLNADTVHNTLNEQANIYGITLSEELTKPWLDASAQAIAWRDELKKDMTEGEWAAMIGEGGAITAFSNGIATKLGGSWDTVKTKAKSYSDFLTGTELKNNFSGAVTTFVSQLQKIIDKWNEIRNAAVAATSVTPTVPSGGSGGGDGGNPTPSPSPTPTKTMNASGKNSSHIRVGKKTDALAKNKKTIGGVEYYLWSDGYYYPMSAFSRVTQDVDENGNKISVYGFPAGTTRYKYYAKGTSGTKHDEWAITDELGPELTMYAGKDGTLSFMRAGSTVVPTELTKELIDIGQVGLNGLMKPNFDAGINVVNNAINKPEYNFNIEALVKADHIDQNSIKDVEKMINKQLDEFTKKLNYSIRGVGGR